jgi:hypothetical protein
MDHGTIHGWLEEWGRLWGVPDLANQVEVSVNPRLKRSLGRCRPQLGTIHLHRQLNEAPEAFQREVLCQEAAHVAAHRLHGNRARPHGPEGALAPRWSYQHSCPVCGTRRIAHRAVRGWRCRPCREAGLHGILRTIDRLNRPGLA